MSSPEVHSTLRNHSTDKYFIEYDGFLTNHLAHGIIALHRLGQPDERIQRFIMWYTPRLESPDYDKTDNRPTNKLKGERVAYYDILKSYEEQLRNKYLTVDELIRNEYPKISAGLAGSALHGTIHLGYGYSIGNEKIILEGLSYVYHSYRPVVTSKTLDELSAFGNGNLDITQSLGILRSDKKLIPQVLEAIKEERWTRLKLGKFQMSVSYLLTDHGDMLTDLVLNVKLGPDLRHSDGTLDPVKLSRRAVYWATVVYASAEPRNNFFLLHGVTCAWALYQVIPLLSQEDGVKAMREYLTVLLAAYVAEGSLELSVPRLDGEYSDQEWSKLVKRTVDLDRDEHCYKLVHVCFEMVKDAHKHEEDPNVYMQAATTAIDYELSFFKGDD